MPSRQARTALVIAVTLATGCAPDDVTAPTADPRPSPSPLYFSRFGYLPTVLPLQYATAINSRGAVVGFLPNRWGAYYAQGVTTVLALPTDGSATVAHPIDLTDDGRIVARGTLGAGGFVNKALYYTGPTAGPTVIGVPGSRLLIAEAMNRQGVVVGSYQTYLDGPFRAFRWTPGAGLVDITPADRSAATARDVAETGEIIGWVNDPQGGVSYRWNAGGASGMALPREVDAWQALNGGSAFVTHPTFGYAIWSLTGGITPAGPDQGIYSGYSIYKVSPSGRFIGTFSDPALGSYRPWTSFGSGDPIALPLPDGFSKAFVTDVNACGTILGVGTLASDNSLHAIMWSTRALCDNAAVLQPGGVLVASP